VFIQYKINKMEKFLLKSKQVNINEFEIDVILYPEHYYLEDKIAVSLSFNSKVDINSQITDAITLYTPILFEKIQEMENIPQYIKDNIEL